jgi:hypothetical protein
MANDEEATPESIHTTVDTGLEVRPVLDISLVDVSQNDPMQRPLVTLAVAEVTPIEKLKRTALLTDLRPQTAPSANRKTQANKTKTAIEVDYSQKTFVIRSSSTK